MDYTTKSSLPYEIKQFRISMDSFKEILNSNLGGEIESINIKKDKVELEISKNFLNSVIGSKYDRDIESIDIDDEEVDIKICNGSEKEKEEVKRDSVFSF